MSEISLEERIEVQQRLVDCIKELQEEERKLRAGILQECFGMDIGKIFIGISKS